MGKITITGLPDFTYLPSRFIEERLRQSGGNEVKVLLALYYVSQKGGAFQSTSLARLCGVTEVDVIDACEYWNGQGVLEILDMDSLGNLDLKFLPDLLYRDETGQEIKEEESLSNKLMEDEAFRDLNQALELSMGRPLNNNLLRFNAELKEDYGFDDEVILMLYGAARNKENRNYMRTIADDWKKANIHTAQEANVHIKLREDNNKTSYELARYMGIELQRAPEPVKNQLTRIVQLYGFELDLLKHAVNRTTKQLGKMDLNYMEGILKKWRDLGIQSLEDAIKMDKKNKGARKRSTEQLTSFNNYNQRDYDYDEVERQLLGLEAEDD